MRIISNWIVLTAVLVVVIVVALVATPWETAAKIVTIAVATLGVIAIAMDGQRSVPSKKGAVPRSASSGG